MNQARTGRYYAEEFEKPRSVFALVATLLALSVLSHGAAIGVGMWIQGERDAAVIAALKAAPKRVAPVVDPGPRWACSKFEHTEYHRACHQRAISEATKPFKE